MTQTTLNFDTPTLPANPFNTNTQAYRLYEWLQAKGEITLHEIHNVLHIDTARIRVDVKRFLRRKGFDVECQRICEGATLYRVKIKGRQ